MLQQSALSLQMTRSITPNQPVQVFRQCSIRHKVLQYRQLHRHASRPLLPFAKQFTTGPGDQISTHNPSRRGSPWWLLLPASLLAGYILTYTQEESQYSWLWAFSYPEVFAEVPDLIIEKPKRKGSTKEHNRDLISSQHVQVKRSWENPGLYAWGSNSSKVAAPGSDEQFIKTPRRIPFFDDLLLRDVKLDRNFGAAVDEQGDLLQWGDGYSRDILKPVKTLVGKNLVSIEISRDRIICLSSNSQVYSVPVSKSSQENGRKIRESSWIPFWSSQPSISYRVISFPNPGWREYVTSISSGLEHALLLTNAGRVFSVASGSEHYPERGQLGIPGLSWTTRPHGPMDQPHELTTLRGFEIKAIATGDYHSLVLDQSGRVFTFGDNTYGQLGFDYTPDSAYIDAPSLIPTQRSYQGTGQQATVTDIYAGGSNSYFSVDASAPNATRINADLWASGKGTQGALGTGRWTHFQGSPTKIKALSGLFEWDERDSKAVPIRVKHLSIGSTHIAAILANETRVSTPMKGGTPNDTNWGADVLWWGGNEFFQLGTGKRNNIAAPMYIAPLDGEGEQAMGRRNQEHRFQITPKKRISVKGRKVDVEQRIECGRNVTAVYSGV